MYSNSQSIMVWFRFSARARKSIKPASVAKTRSRLKRRTLPRARSLSTENETSKTSGYSTSNHHSMERLPTLSAFDEERIVSKFKLFLNKSRGLKKLCESAKSTTMIHSGLAEASWRWHCFQWRTANEEFPQKAASWRSSSNLHVNLTHLNIYFPDSDRFSFQGNFIISFIAIDLYFQSIS